MPAANRIVGAEAEESYPSQDEDEYYDEEYDEEEEEEESDDSDVSAVSGIPWYDVRGEDYA